MNPILFSIGSLDIRWYSLLILLGVSLAYVLINNEAKRFNITREFVFNMIFWVIIFGIIGARLYYVLFNLDYYKVNPTEIIKMWNGGLAIHGGIIAGIIVILVYCKRYMCKSSRMLDIVAPGLLLAQTIGRWGNFFNGEAYGPIIAYDKLVAMKIVPSFVMDNMYINGAYHIPMFYFESLWCLLGFLILLIFRRRKYIKLGQITAFYLMWYGLARFFIEIFRTDSLMIGDYKVARIISVVMFVVGFIIMAIQSRKPKLEELYNTTENEEVTI